jgi:secreted Zn-dependent insulinase-like peptidase
MLLCDDLLTPVNDKRAYRLIELPNRMRALLISDPTIGQSDGEGPRGAAPMGCWPAASQRAAEDDAGSKMAACAIAVGVGYLCDPPHLGGLAHFLEHMLFMGTKKYPRENGWNQFLSAHGGSDNGETDAESTVFYFDVKHDYLHAALHRFGTFFSCPLLKWSGSKREVNAVDAEFAQAAQNDASRVDQLVCAHLSEPSHPYHRFGWGNRKSLVADPKAAAVDVRASHSSPQTSPCTPSPSHTS